MLEHGVSGIFNVGTGEARSFRQLAEAVFAAYGREPAIDYIDMPEQIRDKYQYLTRASLDHVRRVGVPVACDPLEDSVRDYVQCYIRRQDPFRGAEQG